MRVAVREESSLSADIVRDSTNESLSNSHDSVAGVGDNAEFSDDDDVPAGKYSPLSLIYRAGINH